MKWKHFRADKFKTVEDASWGIQQVTSCIWTSIGHWTSKRHRSWRSFAIFITWNSLCQGTTATRCRIAEGRTAESSEADGTAAARVFGCSGGTEEQQFHSSWANRWATVSQQGICFSGYKELLDHGPWWTIMDQYQIIIWSWRTCDFATRPWSWPFRTSTRRNASGCFADASPMRRGFVHPAPAWGESAASAGGGWTAVGQREGSDRCAGAVELRARRAQQCWHRELPSAVSANRSNNPTTPLWIWE